jgi:hypothetical protein
MAQKLFQTELPTKSQTAISAAHRAKLLEIRDSLKAKIDEERKEQEYLRNRIKVFEKVSFYQISLKLRI